MNFFFSVSNKNQNQNKKQKQNEGNESVSVNAQAMIVEHAQTNQTTTNKTNLSSPELYKQNNLDLDSKFNNSLENSFKFDKDSYKEDITEPKFTYDRIGNYFTEIIDKDSATCLTLHERVCIFKLCFFSYFYIKFKLFYSFWLWELNLVKFSYWIFKATLWRQNFQLIIPME